MRVLYVEDSDSDADLACRYMARYAPDIELEVAASLAVARRCLEVAREGIPYDLLLADLYLPDGSGLELLRDVRQESLKLPVVLLTGQGDEHAAIAALKGGAQDYIIKRGDYLEHLPTLLRDVVQRSSALDFSGHQLQVLYLEPNPADSELTRIYLRQLAPQIRLEIVQTGRQVLEKLGGHGMQDQVLLLAGKVPDMDAMELVRILRQEHQNQCPIVLITGQGSEEGAAEALHLGVDDYLIKTDGYLKALPLNLEKIQRQVALVREKVALQDANEQLNEILDASTTVLFKLRYEGGVWRPLWFSPNLQALVGDGPDEAMGADWWHARVHPLDRERALTQQEDLLVTGEAVREYRFRHKEGHYLWLRDRIRLIKHGDAQSSVVVGTWVDVTRVKVGELAWQARMKVRSLIFDGAPLDRVLEEIVLNLEGIYTTCRGAILLRDGLGVMQVRAAPSLDVTYRQQVAAAGQSDCSLKSATARNTLFIDDMDDPRLCKACSSFHREHGIQSLWSLPIVASQGKMLGLFNVYAQDHPGDDEFMQRRLEEFAQMAALAVERVEGDRDQRLAATVLANTHDGVMVTDLSPAIVLVNQAWSEMTGYRSEEALGQSPSLVKSDLQSPEFYQEMWNTLLSQGDWQGELWNRRKNGETYPQFLSISTVRDTTGKPTHFVAVMTDLSHLRQSEHERDRLTHYDPLTQLPNRLLALARLEHAISQASSGAVGVILLDLDDFNAINDSLGHDVGDRVLRLLAQELRGCLRQQDTLARLGGDEFLIIVEHMEKPEVLVRFCEVIQDMLHRPRRLSGGQEVYVGGSMGLSVFPEDGATAHELIQRANTALHHVKREGRDTFRFYTSALTAQVYERLKLESHLRKALERGELVLHYQPQVDILSGKVCGMEALMRWESPELGRVSPGAFIPVAEQSGLILPMGTWALNEACRQNKAWLQAGLPPMVMAVNVSVRQFKAGDLVEQVAQVLEETGLPPSLLEIELTESAFMEDAEAAIITSRKLHELGVKLSLDDFGTGYSSLAYLSRFAFDKIKIDQSFVRDITSNPINAAIANAAIALAESLHMSVLAEGVETEAQLGFLRRQGCQVMQGFLVSPALPAEAFATLVREGKGLPMTQHVAEAHTLLLVDDEPNILNALQRLLRQDGYHILTTSDPQQAFSLLAEHSVQVVVADQRMPAMNGTDFLSQVKELYPDTIRIVLSSYSDIEAITRAINRGAIYKYLRKPWDDQELRQELREAFRMAERQRRRGTYLRMQPGELKPG